MTALFSPPLEVSAPDQVAQRPRDEQSWRTAERVPKREKGKTRPVPRGYESIDGTILTEPRIDAIRRELQALLRVVQVEVDERPVEVDGFRLRQLEDWADSPTSLSGIFWHLSSVCNFRCEFCYEKGNPNDFPIHNTTRMASLSEIDTRLKYYDAVNQRGLFSIRSSINEPFVNKNAVEILRKIRSKNPDELISFVTNGSLLGEEAIDAIASMSPVFFNLSLYSVDPKVRRTVLGDARPHAAVEAVARLSARRIPFMANLVMWPSISFEDMARTIRYLDENGAALIRVCLGGYSRYLQGSFERFEASHYWPQVVDAVEAIRPHCCAPLLIEPNNFARRDDAPLLDGIIAGSPAARAGLEFGDEVVSVNGRPISTRMQLASTIRAFAGTRVRRFCPPGVSGDLGPINSPRDLSISLAIRNADGTRTVVLQRYDAESMRSYPYSQLAAFDDFMFGLVITDGLQYSSLKRARDIIEQEQARRTLILTSVMMGPIVEFMAKKSGVFHGLDIAIVSARNEYFGGSINIGDLLVVSDFVAAIERFRIACHVPDLVLVPSTPFASSPWGRDLRGVPWTDIERLSGVPVRLVPCQTITF